MMALFEGFAGAHGTHGATSQNVDKGGKLEIKKTALTVREAVTEEVWEDHLAGRRPLGVIPIREDGTCMWGCIDVDQYDLSHADAVTALGKRKLPMVVCKSKSGGAHVFLFLSEPAPAEELQAYLHQVSAQLGWGDSEVFPKQTRILVDRGDLGNWLNMPYLGGDATTRYGVKSGGAGMTLSEFLAYAEERRVRLRDLVGGLREPEDESLDDGPPCLQHLAVVGFPDGSRNNGLFSLGVFCKRKFGERWKQMLEQYNRDYMRPPLESQEVMDVIGRLEKKDYNYKCKDAPCVNYCNSALCRTRRYGVGGGDSYPVISGLSKLDAGDATLWFMDIDGERIELTTDELQNYRLFQKRCMEELTRFFMPLKADTWAAMVGSAMQSAVIIEPSPEVTTSGHLMELLESFLMNRHRGQAREDLLLGRPWLDPDTNRHYFRLSDFMTHLRHAEFRELGRNRVAQRIVDIGGKQFLNIKGKGINVLWVEADRFERTPEVALPELREEPI